MNTRRQRLIANLRQRVEHPSTPEGERELARTKLLNLDLEETKEALAACKLRAADAENRARALAESMLLQDSRLASLQAQLASATRRAEQAERHLKASKAEAVVGVPASAPSAAPFAAGRATPVLPGGYPSPAICTWRRPPGSDQWAIHGPAEQIFEGAKVTVYRQDGTTSEKLIAAADPVDLYGNRFGYPVR